MLGCKLTRQEIVGPNQPECSAASHTTIEENYRNFAICRLQHAGIGTTTRHHERIDTPGQQLSCFAMLEFLLVPGRRENQAVSMPAQRIGHSGGYLSEESVEQFGNDQADHLRLAGD